MTAPFLEASKARLEHPGLLEGAGSRTGRAVKLLPTEPFQDSMIPQLPAGSTHPRAQGHDDPSDLVAVARVPESKPWSLPAIPALARCASTFLASGIAKKSIRCNPITGSASGEEDGQEYSQGFAAPGELCGDPLGQDLELWGLWGGSLHGGDSRLGEIRLFPVSPCLW